jgi:hypothetical protein
VCQNYLGVSKHPHGKNAFNKSWTNAEKGNNDDQTCSEIVDFPHEKRFTGYFPLYSFSIFCSWNARNSQMSVEAFTRSMSTTNPTIKEGEVPWIS